MTEEPNRPVSTDQTQPSIREDMNDALRHLHFMSMQTKHDMVDVVSRIYALIEQLAANQQLDLGEFEARRAHVREQEEIRMRERAYVQVDTTPDKYALTDLPQIDCAARIHLCHARCCKLEFALSFQDLDERIVEWDYALPYRIRHKPNGYCVHNDSATGGCGVYKHRPGVCRVYDCRYDKRIWLDFEQGIPTPYPEEQLVSGEQ